MSSLQLHLSEIETETPTITTTKNIGGIPCIIHFVWFGPLPLPELIVDSWRAHHPEFEIKVWNESNLCSLYNQSQFDKTSRFNQKSDIARYEILLRYGGVYVDCDLMCIRSIIPLLSKQSSGRGIGIMCAWEKKNLISNSFIVCNPGNTVMKQIVNNIPRGEAFDITKPVWKVTGPLYFMNEIELHRNNDNEDVLVLDYYHFNLCYDFNLWDEDVLKYSPDMQSRSKNRDIRFNCLKRKYTIRDCYGIQLWCGGKPGNYNTLCKRSAYDIVKNLKRYIRYMYLVRAGIEQCYS